MEVSKLLYGLIPDHTRPIAQSMEDIPVSISTRYVLIASMGVTPEAETLFNEICDTEHVPNLLQVPGVRSVTRMKGGPARFAIAGAVRELPAPSPNTVHFVWIGL